MSTTGVPSTNSVDSATSAMHDTHTNGTSSSSASNKPSTNGALAPVTVPDSHTGDGATAHGAMDDGASTSSEEPAINFEGPEKVLEVWFVPPDQWEENAGNALPADNAVLLAGAEDGASVWAAVSDAKAAEARAAEARAKAIAAAAEGESKTDTTVAVAGTTAAPASTGAAPGRRYLLTVPRSEWEEMLELVHCQILSSISNDKADAYLLSESSMFVYEFQVVIKTCGTTTLLNCLPKLLDIAARVGLHKVDDVFYNRQNFFFPEKQLHPHVGFKAECRTLDSYFRNGGAYIVGRVNENHYNFYNAESRMTRSDPIMQEVDSTLEVLMTGLDPVRMRSFYHSPDVDTAEVRRRTGIADFFPEALIDDYMFEPFGYSLNGLTADGYFTIHVTPQPNCSFASFETNVFLPDYTELIEKVLRAFQPSRFIVTNLANTLATQQHKHRGSGINRSQLVATTPFKVVDDISCRFEHYDLSFLQLEKGAVLSPNSAAALAAACSATAAPASASSAPAIAATSSSSSSSTTVAGSCAAAAAAVSAAACASAAERVQHHPLPGLAAATKRRLDEDGILKTPASPFLKAAPAITPKPLSLGSTVAALAGELDSDDEAATGAKAKKVHLEAGLAEPKAPADRSEADAPATLRASKATTLT